MSVKTDSSRFVLERDVSRLRAVHRQRVERHGDAPAMPTFSSQDLPPKVLPLAIAGFQQLLESEYESVVIAAWMSAALARLGAPLDLVGAFGKVVEDEVRHVDLVAQMLEALGAAPSLPRAPLPPRAELVSGEGALLEVLSGLMGFFCIGEELSAHIFKASLGLAKHAPAKWLVSEIFQDEAMHGPFGFETARVLLVDLAPQHRAVLQQRLVDEIARFEKRIGGPLAAGAARADFSDEEKVLAEWGLLPKEALLQIFYERVERSVLPRLAEIGLPLELSVRETSGPEVK